MKGFFSWFKSENKIKRWLFLILVSMIAICYAMSTIFVTESLDITSVFKIVIFGLNSKVIQRKNSYIIYIRIFWNCFFSCFYSKKDIRALGKRNR